MPVCSCSVLIIYICVGEYFINLLIDHRSFQDRWRSKYSFKHYKVCIQIEQRSDRTFVKSPKAWAHIELAMPISDWLDQSCSTVNHWHSKYAIAECRLEWHQNFRELCTRAHCKTLIDSDRIEIVVTAIVMGFRLVDLRFQLIRSEQQRLNSHRSWVECGSVDTYQGGCIDF